MESWVVALPASPVEAEAVSQLVLHRPGQAAALVLLRSWPCGLGLRWPPSMLPTFRGRTNIGDAPGHSTGCLCSLLLDAPEMGELGNSKAPASAERHLDPSLTPAGIRALWPLADRPAKGRGIGSRLLLEGWPQLLFFPARLPLLPSQASSSCCAAEEEAVSTPAPAPGPASPKPRCCMSAPRLLLLLPRRQKWPLEPWPKWAALPGA